MKNNKPKISIVMPMYNQEGYIAECLKSVMNQTLKDIEIIVVDDGSNDKSPEIVKGFAKKDKRILLIQKPNSGYGNSMNIGFSAASGEYIGIVETDDYVEKDMFSYLYKTAKKFDADIVKSDYYEFSSLKKKQQHYIQTPTSTNYYNRVLTPRDDVQIYHFKMNTWTGIYKNEFIKLNNIRHNETPGASYQDNGFWFQTLSLSNRVVFVDRAFYHYRQDNPNSSINSKGKVFCMCDEYAFIRSFLEKRSFLYQKLIKIYLAKKYYNYFHTYDRIADEHKIAFLKRFADEFNSSFNAKEFDEYLLPYNEMNVLFRIMRNPTQFYYDDTIWRLNHTYYSKINYNIYLNNILEKNHDK